MKAYVIVNVDVHDRERYPDYVKVAPESIRAHGGRYIARGGRSERLEGKAWEPKRVVLLEFPSYEQARAWWSSQAYAGPKKLRQACAHTEMILVEGCEPII
jgi:uncharacterized protein (DUF1330 family)